MSVKTIMFEIEGLIKNAVMSCAAMYGFSAEEALAKIDSNGNLIRAVVDKEAEKAEKQRVKEAEKQQKEAEKQQKEAGKALIKQLKESLVKQQKAEIASMKEEDILSKAAEKLALKQKKEAEKAEKLQKEAEKALIKQKKEAEKAEKAELASMKEEEILSKAAEKLALKQKKEAEKKTKKVKKVAVIEPSHVIKSASEDEEPFIRFKNIPLMNEINSICDVKKFKNHKKLSVGVKLARQILDI
jgi:hypothetical protein